MSEWLKRLLRAHAAAKRTRVEVQGLVQGDYIKGPNGIAWVVGPVKTAQFAWVIECTHPEGGLLYWTGKGVVDFSPHHADAIRFSREQDAKTVRDWTLKNPFLRVVEHGWSH